MSNKTTQLIMNILLIDDHPLILLAYKKIISESMENRSITFKELQNCEQTFKFLEQENLTYDLAIIDYRIPPYQEESLYDGADLAKIIQSKLYGCKVLIITGIIDNIIVYDILKKINPDGLAIKSEIDSSNLPVIVREITSGNKFYSESLKDIIKSIWEYDLLVDSINRKIVLSIVKGYKIKDVSKIVNLSFSATQKRLNKIEQHFNVNSQQELIRKIFEKKMLS